MNAFMNETLEVCAPMRFIFGNFNFFVEPISNIFLRIQAELCSLKRHCPPCFSFITGITTAPL